MGSVNFPSGIPQRWTYVQPEREQRGEHEVEVKEVRFCRCLGT